MRIIDIVDTTTAFTCFNTKRKKNKIIPLTLITCGLTLYSWFFIEIQLNGTAFNKCIRAKVDKNANPVKKHFLINASILLYYVILFH